MPRIPPAAARLLLFDIDGTLIHKGGMGSIALRRAFSDLHGLPDALATVRLDGKTDPNICREVFELHELSWSDAAFRAVLDAYLRRLQEEAALRPLGQLCPGIPALLDALADRPNCILGLLTGNVRAGAELKLRAFGIWERFSLGAYGNDGARRVDLVEVALERAAELHGIRFAPHEAVVIGDTPADVETARHNGCRSVAVATGHYGVEALRQHGPDHVLPDLGDTGAAMAAFGLS